MRRLFILFFSVGFLCYQNSVIAETVKLGTGEWAPYTSVKMEGFGVFTEILTAAFKEMKVTPTYEFYPWKRAELKVKKGDFFAVFPYKATEERKKIFDFSERIIFSTGRFFYIKKNFPQGVNYNTFEDLIPYKIGGILGYWYEKPFKKAGLKVKYTATDEESIKYLYHDYVHVVASDELVGWALIKSLYPQEISQFATMDKPLNQSDLHLMISRKYPNAVELTKRFNAALKKIRKKGIVNQILAKHGLKE